MKRREFITLVGGTAVGWPLAARAQDRVRRVGALMNLPADDQEAQLNMAAFQQGLQELGWIIGRNLRLDHRWGPLDRDGLRRRAEELVALAPDVMIVAGGSAGEAVQRASRTLPVVLAQSVDPVGAGFVSSLARPRRQHHWLYPVRIQSGGQMAAASQGDCSRRNQRRRPSRSRRSSDCRRGRSVGCYSGHDRTDWSGSDSNWNP